MRKIIFLFLVLLTQNSFAQYTLTRGLPLANISGTGTAVTLSDDNYSVSLPIGFSFSFFGNTYTSFYIGSNGYLSFSQGYSVTTFSIPSTSTPNNVISFAGTDQDCSAGSPSINYFTVGTSPNKVLVVNYNNVEEFGNSANITSVQIQLFEGSNKIEIHSLLNQSDGGNRTIGIENLSGTQGVTETGLNNSSTIVANNETIRFEPCVPTPININASSLYYCQTPIILTVVNCTGNILWGNGSTGNTITVSPASNTTYTVSCNINGCSSTASKIIQTAFLSGGPSISGNQFICPGGKDLLYSPLKLSTDTLQWFKNGNPILNETTDQYLAETTGSYYVQNKKYGCTINSNTIVVSSTNAKSQTPIIGIYDSWVCKSQKVDFKVSSTGSYTRFRNDKVYFESSVTGADMSIIIDVDSKVYIIAREDGKCDSDTSNNLNLKVVTATLNINSEACGNRMEIITSPIDAPISSYQWYTTPNNTSILGANSKVYFANQNTHSGRAFLANGCSLFVGPGFGPSTGIQPNIYAFKYDSLGNTFKTRKKSSFSSSKHMIKSIKLQNGDDLIIGSLNSSTNFYLERINNSGVIVWTKTINASTSFSTVCRDVVENLDGSILIGGSSKSNISNNKSENSRGKYDYWIVKLSSTGTIIWDKTIGGSGDDILNSISLSVDGNLLLGGTSNSPVSGEKSETSNAYDTINGNSTDGWIVKLSQSGAKIFDKVIGAGNKVYPEKIENVQVIQNPDETYLFLCNTNQNIGSYKSLPSYGENDIWVLKTSNSFVKIWDTSIGGQGNEKYNSFLKNVNGEIKVLGESTSNPSGNKTSTNYGQIDLFLTNLNSGGQVLWDKTFGGSNIETPISFHQIKNSNSYYIIANTSSQNSPTKRARNRYNSKDLSWILQIDQLGNLINDVVIEDLDDLITPSFAFGSNIDDQNEIHIYCSGNYSFGKFANIVSDNSILPANSNYKLIANNCASPTWSNGALGLEIFPLINGTYSAKCGNCYSNSLVYGSLCPSVINLLNPINNINNQTVTVSASVANGLISASNIISGSTFYVKYQSKAIELLPGFSASGPGVFAAEIGGCNN